MDMDSKAGHRIASHLWGGVFGVKFTWGSISRWYLLGIWSLASRFGFFIAVERDRDTIPDELHVHPFILFQKRREHNSCSFHILAIC